jgi:hypothetical protein
VAVAAAANKTTEELIGAAARNMNVPMLFVAK